MAMSKEVKIGLGIGAAALATVWLTSRGSKVATHAKAYYRAGESFRVWQGVPFVMKLPRGEYLSLNPELQIMTQNDYGNQTDVQLLAIAAPSNYTVNGILSEADRPDRLHRFTVTARKPV